MFQKSSKCGKTVGKGVWGRGEISSIIGMEEVMEAFMKTKSGRATEQDLISGEQLKLLNGSLIEWLMGICRCCVEARGVPDDWKGASDVPLCRGKGDKKELCML